MHEPNGYLRVRAEPTFLVGQVFSDETFGTATVHAPEAVIGGYGGGTYDGWYRFTKVEKLTQGSDLAYDLEKDGFYYILYAKRQEPIQTGDGEIIKTYYDAYITQTACRHIRALWRFPGHLLTKRTCTLKLSV